VSERPALLRRWGWVGMAGLLGAACAESTTPVDDAAPVFPDSSFTPLTCQAEFGFSYVLTEMLMLPEGEGMDITGDGVPDNALGFIAPLANAATRKGIMIGDGVYVADFTEWDGPPTRDDPDLRLTLYEALDVDNPIDPSNNYEGEGRFYVHHQQFDIGCVPLSTADEAVLVDGVVTARAPRWRIVVTNVGTIEFVDMRIVVSFDPGFGTFHGELGAIWPVCVLSRTIGPLFAGRSLLDIMVNDLAHPEPDIDLDSDGNEVLIGNGLGVATCIDGDGTSLPGPDCVCDARITDGYSVAMQIEAVPATIEGVVDPS
jgi:hypothetical protein